MLFKLSVKNMKKSMKDYAIYFLTLILGVAIFYVFNALDGQKAMLGLSQSGYQMVNLMVQMISLVSGLVAFILGFLIVYANNFLIKRRKKEFGVYMMLGMGKGGISGILFGETILIGILSLGVGLLLGVFASQFMSILVAKLFEADVTAYTFTVSVAAVKKTILNFCIMYVIVLVFNAFSISHYKLIDLFQASQKGEKQTMKNTGLAVVVFLLAAGILGYAYYQVAYRSETVTQERAALLIAMGCVGTFLVFWSLSGFLLKLLQRFKGVYHRNLNTFVLRQLSSNINTAVFSMTVICLLLFATICAFCSGMSMNNSLRTALREMTPVDICVQKLMSLPAEGDFSEAQRQNGEKTVLEALADFGFAEENLREYVEISIYRTKDLTFGTMLGAYEEQLRAQFPFVNMNTTEDIVGVSEYNKVAALYGTKTYTLAEDEYLILCDFSNMANMRNLALSGGEQITIGAHTLKPRFAECQEGYLAMSASHINAGIVIVPDAVIEAELGGTLSLAEHFLAGNYAAETKEEKQMIENILLDVPKETAKEYAGFDAMTRISIYESATGLAVIITFVVLYLGIIFLISGAALLALKALSESTDSKARYEILQKVGADEKMIHRALLLQLLIFFLLPLLVAMIHSIFGMRFIRFMLSIFNQGDMLASVGVTAAILLVIYGGYFLATYYGSRRIIEEK
ncbi:MAG: FtsX-like permease family protein [Lachnospiraceae bacterium]